MASRAYGQYCPIARASEILADRWTPLIIRELLAGIDRFNALQRGLPGIPRSILADRLRRLEREGVVERGTNATGHAPVYRLTPAGQDLQRVMDVLADWGSQWAFGDPLAHELDPALLLWWLQRRVHRDRLPPQRVVVRFDFHGERSGSYWLLLEPTEVSVCLRNPGFDVDLLVTADIAGFYRVFLGRLLFAAAQRAGLVQVDGPPALARAFANDWIAWYTFRAPEWATSSGDASVVAVAE